MSIPGSFKTKVVGISKVDSYPENIYALEDIVSSRRLTAPVAFNGENVSIEPIPSVLVRNPANAFDSNAIEVHVPSLGDAAFIGHVPAKVAERLAPCLDQGEIWKADIYKVAIHPHHPENPGVHIFIEKIEDSEEPF